MNFTRVSYIKVYNSDKPTTLGKIESHQSNSWFHKKKWKKKKKGSLSWVLTSSLKFFLLYAYN